MKNNLPEYKRMLYGLINTLTAQMNLDEEEQLTIGLLIDSKKKALKLGAWMKPRLQGDTLNATKDELLHAVSVIARGEDIA